MTLDIVRRKFDRLGLENVDHIKRKWISFISSQKAFLCSQFSFSSAGKWWEQQRGMTICSPYCRRRAEDGHSPMLQLLFSQFPLEAFDCTFSWVLYSTLAISCRFSCPENPSDLPSLFSRHLPSTWLTFWPFKILSVLPFWPLQIAASVWLNNACYRKYLSAVVPL